MKRRAFVLLNRGTNAVVKTLRLRQFRGSDLLMLTTVGRNSGRRRTTPVLYLRDGDDWIVVASNGGADWEPGWWLNLQAGCDAEVTVDATTTPVSGAEIQDPERQQLWQVLNDRVFDYESYQVKVHRRLAVARLTAVPG